MSYKSGHGNTEWTAEERVQGAVGEGGGGSRATTHRCALLCAGAPTCAGAVEAILALAGARVGAVARQDIKLACGTSHSCCFCNKVLSDEGRYKGVRAIFMDELCS